MPAEAGAESRRDPNLLIESFNSDSPKSSPTAHPSSEGYLYNY